MKKYAAFTALLLTVLTLLCACGGQEPAQEDAPPPEDREEQALYRWDTMWDGPGAEPLALAYAQSFSVDLSEYGYARITIDGDVYLLVPEKAPLPQGTPEDVVILQQPIGNIYLQATSSMDCFRRLDALDAIALSGTQADGWYIPEAREAMDKFKMEAASEVGVNLKQGYNGDLSSREAGSVGGQMVKKMIESYEKGL